mgnify:CR=1 FL=1
MTTPLMAGGRGEGGEPHPFALRKRGPIRRARVAESGGLRTVSQGGVLGRCSRGFVLLGSYGLRNSRKSLEAVGRPKRFRLGMSHASCVCPSPVALRCWQFSAVGMGSVAVQRPSSSKVLSVEVHVRIFIRLRALSSPHSTLQRPDSTRL